ncbi:HDOD domain-containing protein [Noviherbaspirillum aerium]|uniref:HDOD domain-containing protein n=1 Tax=Noviherbaspirillum aerium TaxID=2588497 RepID=UPI00124BEA7D|nr:HDOD domain-containing protein [Noviherbaspirillum aerium]
MYDWLRRLFSDAGKPARTVQPAAAPVPSSPSPPPRQPSFAADSVSTLQRDQVDFVFASWLFEAESHPDIFTNGNEDAILAALDGVVKSEQAGAHLVRRMPGVIPQLLQSLRSGDFTGPELARKISQDVVLVAEVLRLANSAAYSPGKPIDSIDHAILILGQDGLRQLITGVAFKPIIDLHSGSFTRMVAPRLWAQSERCALANRLLASGEAADPLDVFLAGLVQNVGLTVSLRVIDQMSDGRQPVGSPTFCNALAGFGRTLAVNIGSEWHFPDTVMKAIREQGESVRPAAMSPVGRVLWMGDYLSKIDILSRHQRLDPADPHVTDGLSGREMDCLRQLAEVEERDWLGTAGGNK